MNELTYEKLFYMAGEVERDILAKLRAITKQGKADTLYQHKDFPASYDEQGIVAPDYIRHIAVINDQKIYQWFKVASNRMVELHKQAVILKSTITGQGKYTKPPRRYPVFLENVFSIKVVEKQAVTSSVLEKDGQIALVSLKTKWGGPKDNAHKLNMMNDYAIRLGKIGINAEVSSGILYASTKDIYHLSGAKSIQVRAPTGTHYKAYIKYNDKTAKTIACAFILSPAPFYLIEQKKGSRGTAISDVAKQIEFLNPYTINKSFWIKNQ